MLVARYDDDDDHLYVSQLFLKTLLQVFVYLFTFFDFLSGPLEQQNALDKFFSCC